MLISIGLCLMLCDFFKELSFLSDLLSTRPKESNLFTPPPSPAVSVSTKSTEDVLSVDVTSPQSNSLDNYTSRGTETKKNKKSKGNELDELLASSLQHDETENSDSGHFVIKVGQLKGLTKRQNKEARIRIMQIFLDYEYED